MKQRLGLFDGAARRMQRAHQRGTGCRLTMGMISALAFTPVGKYWRGRMKKLERASKRARSR